MCGWLLMSKRSALAKDLPRLIESRWDAQWMLSCCDRMEDPTGCGHSSSRPTSREGAVAAIEGVTPCTGLVPHAYLSLDSS
jgi:hypothetical protein